VRAERGLHGEGFGLQFGSRSRECGRDVGERRLGNMNRRGSGLVGGTHMQVAVTLPHACELGRAGRAARAARLLAAQLDHARGGRAERAAEQVTGPRLGGGIGFIFSFYFSPFLYLNLVLGFEFKFNHALRV
jgi:hypothetical protein